jgi:hypothetical protein
MKYLYVFFSIFILSLSNIFSQDTIKFFREPNFFFIANIGMDGFKAVRPDTTIYANIVTVGSKLGYFFKPKLGAGINFSHTSTYSNHFELSNFWRYGVFLDYFPFNKKNIYLTGNLLRSNACFNNDWSLATINPTIVDSRDRWLYGTIGAGFYLKIVRFLYFNFDMAMNYNINDCKECDRPTIFWNAGFMVLPSKVNRR